MDLDKIIAQIRANIPYARLVGIDIRVRWGIVVGLPVIIVIAMFFLLISPKVVEKDELNNKLVKARMDVQKKQALEQRLPEFELEIKQKDYELSLLRRQLPEEREIPDLIDQISNIGTQSGLQFLTFKPESEKERDFYSEVPVSLRMVGTFHNLVAFFDRISRLPRIVTVANLNIKASKAKKEATVTQVVATCKAITFRFIEARVDEPKEEAPK